MTDLIPVVFPRHPPLASPEGGAEPFLQNRIADLHAPRLVQRFIKPVVTDGKRKRHFRDIQEMSRIPVREIRGRAHFKRGAFGKCLFPGQTERRRKRVDPVKDIAAHSEQTPSLHDPFRRFFLQKHPRVMDHACGKGFSSCGFPGFQQRAESGSGVDEEAGMRVWNFRQHDLFLPI